MSDTDNELKAQFSIEAAQAKTDSEVMEIAKNIFGNLENHEDYIIAFAEQKGIPITEKLRELQEQTTKAKEDAKKLRERDDTKAVAEKQKQTLDEYINNLSDGHQPEEPEMIKAMAEVEKAIASLTIPQEQSYIATFDKYLHECSTYDPSKDFSPDLFGNIPFPNGTVSYIGARTGRGKTSAMINLAREAITHANNPRRAIFVTLEMSPKELITKLVFSIGYAKAKKDNNQEVLEVIEKKEDKKQLRNCY